MLTKFCATQVKWNQLIQQQAKCFLVKKFLYVLYEVKQIRVNQGVGVIHIPLILCRVDLQRSYSTMVLHFFS